MKIQFVSGVRIILWGGAILLFIVAAITYFFSPADDARRLASDEKYQEAEKLLTSWLANPIYKNDPELYVLRAFDRRFQDNFKGAKEDLETAINLRQANQFLWAGKSQGVNHSIIYMIFQEYSFWYEDQDLFTDALEYRKKALEIEDNPYMRLEYAKAYENLNQLDKAKAELDEVVKESAGEHSGLSAKALCRRASILIDTGKFQDALTDLDASIKEKPTALAYYNRGVAKFRLNDLKSAILDCDATLKKDPDNYDAFSLRGLCKLGLADYKGAIADFDQAIKISPDGHESFYNRAIGWRELSENKKALSDCEQSLKLKPDYQLAKDLRAKILSGKI